MIITRKSDKYEKAFLDFLKLDLFVRNTVSFSNAALPVSMLGGIAALASIPIVKSIKGNLRVLVCAGVLSLGAVLGFLIGKEVISLLQRYPNGVDPREFWRSLSHEEQVVIGKYCLEHRTSRTVLTNMYGDRLGSEYKYYLDSTGENIIEECDGKRTRVIKKAVLPDKIKISRLNDIKRDAFAAKDVITLLIP